MKKQNQEQGHGGRRANQTGRPRKAAGMKPQTFSTSARVRDIIAELAARRLCSVSEAMRRIVLGSVDEDENGGQS